MNAIQENAIVLTKELKWLATVIDTRMKLYFSQETDVQNINEIPVPDIAESNSNYAVFLKENELGFSERIILLLALAPHIQPQILDVFLLKNTSLDKRFTEFGGITLPSYNGLYPTGETAAFILAGNDLSVRFSLTEIFGERHCFSKKNVLYLNNAKQPTTVLSNAIMLSTEYLNYFTTAVAYKPDFDIHFPAKRITTELDWDDLILDNTTLENVSEIKDWINYSNTLLNDWEMKKHIKPGYRSLFYGFSGTGKTLTASLLGKEFGMDVYRINLRMIVSKYIGETEKKLANIFQQAENKNWILFFDEADALFGKRTQINNSGDRYANQEVAYLLQRIEDYSGVVILATNLKSNIDEAFCRRFQSIIYFPIPSAEQREKLWQQSFSKKSVPEPKINFAEIASKYELSGGSIINVSRYCSLKALSSGNNQILYKDLLEGIRKEFVKEGKTI